MERRLPGDNLGKLGQLIPARLIGDTCPLAGADGADAIWVVDEEAPSGFAGLGDIVVGVPHLCGRVGGDVTVPTPHRPERADFLHSVLHGRG